MKGWTEKTVKQLVDEKILAKPLDGNHGEIHPKKSDFTDSGIPFVMAANLINGLVDQENCKFISQKQANSLRKGFAKNEDVLLSHKGTIGRVAILKTLHEYIVLTPQVTYYRILNPSLLNNKFLYYSFQSPKFQEQIINIAKIGSTRAYIGITRQLQLKIPLPPLEEQKQIVAILDEAFEGIDKAIQNTEKNLANAREIFESYLNSIFINKGDDWVEKKLGDVCHITSKLVDPRESDFIDLPHVGAANIVSKTGDLIDVKTARDEKLKSGKFIFDQKMILYSKIRPYLMKVCRPNFQGLCSADVYPLLPDKSYINRDFLFYLLLSKQFTSYSIAGSDRAGMPKVNRKHLFKYNFQLPDISEQIKFTKKVDEILAETQCLETIYKRKIEALKELKQSILQKAFTGELTNPTVNKEAA